MKKRIIFICVIICMIMCVCLFIKISGKGKSEYLFATTIPICQITEKNSEDGFFLTVVLDDWYVKENHLPHDEFTIQARESVYNKVKLGEGYIGACLETTIPDDQPKTSDIGVILKEGNTDYCEIISITADGNISIY